MCCVGLFSIVSRLFLLCSTSSPFCSILFGNYSVPRNCVMYGVCGAFVITIIQCVCAILDNTQYISIMVFSVDGICAREKRSGDKGNERLYVPDGQMHFIFFTQLLQSLSE